MIILNGNENIIGWLFWLGKISVIDEIKFS
jgi:hypothetical protein